MTTFVTPSPHRALLDTRAAAEFLGLAHRTLENWRILRSDGPPFLKICGSIRYKPDELEAWASARRYRSTSEAGHANRAA